MKKLLLTLYTRVSKELKELGSNAGYCLNH